MGSNPGPYTEYGKNSCAINLGPVGYKVQFMVNGIMHNVIIHSYKQMLSVNYHIPLHVRSVYIVCTYYLD